MVQPAEGALFGRRGFARPSLPIAPPKAAPGRPPRVDPANPFLKVLDRVFLWIPNDHAPGIPAVGLFLIRQFTLPLILMIAPVLVFLVAAPNANLVEGLGKMPNWLLPPFMMGSIALVQELGRYSFVRNADRPVRSLSVFTAAAIAFVLLMYHDNLARLGLALVAQFAAGAAIFYGLRYRRWIALIVAAIVVGHTAVYMAAPDLFGSQADSAKREQPASTSPDPPAVDDMQSWAKLYPGATVTESKTENFLGLTSWKVTYKVQASPEQIGSFYEGIATRRGFTDSTSLGGYHRFTQDSTRNDFSYAVVSETGVSEVIFEARTFGRTAPTN
jgi:hypothetical protein